MSALCAFSPTLWQQMCQGCFHYKIPNFQPVAMVYLFHQNTAGLELRDQFISGDSNLQYTVASFGETHVGGLSFLSSSNGLATFPRTAGNCVFFMSLAPECPFPFPSTKQVVKEMAESYCKLGYAQQMMPSI